MRTTRRQFGRLAVPATTLLGRSAVGVAAAARAGRPDSLVNGLRIGTITCGFRSMPGQRPDATLRHRVDVGTSAIELMNGPVEAYARARTGYAPPDTGGRGGGRGRGRGRPRGVPDPPTLTGSWNRVACRPIEPASDPVIGEEPLSAAGDRRRAEPTPEQLAAERAEHEWRMSLSDNPRSHWRYA